MAGRRQPEPKQLPSIFNSGFRCQHNTSRLAKYESSSVVPNQTDNFAGPSMALGQVSDHQSDDEAEALIQEGVGDENGDKDFNDGVDGGDDDDDDDNLDIDNSEFVLSGEKVHTESPGGVREDNGFLEWYNPKTSTWRMLQSTDFTYHHRLMFCRSRNHSPQHSKSSYSTGTGSVPRALIP